MNELEKNILREEAGDIEPRLCLRTNTRIDAGRWWRRTAVWLCLTDDEVIVLAAARRRYVQRIGIVECRESFYCHATGEMVLAPVETLTYGRLAMPPQDALNVLELLKTEKNTQEKNNA